MKSDIDLFNQYKEEKALVIGDVDERTGLEPFETFKEWKAVYVEEYNATHQTVEVKKADKMMDKLVEEAEAELEELADQFESDDEIVEEEEEMTEATAATKAKKKVPAKKKVSARKRATDKQNAGVKRQAAKRKATRPVAKKVARANSKAAQAQKIFNRLYGKKARAEIINKFIADAGLTANGAATYYQKFKKAAG